MISQTEGQNILQELLITLYLVWGSPCITTCKVMKSGLCCSCSISHLISSLRKYMQHIYAALWYVYEISCYKNLLQLVLVLSREGHSKPDSQKMQLYDVQYSPTLSVPTPVCTFPQLVPHMILSINPHLFSPSLLHAISPHIHFFFICGCSLSHPADFVYTKTRV